MYILSGTGRKDFATVFLQYFLYTEQVHFTSFENSLYHVVFVMYGVNIV